MFRHKHWRLSLFILLVGAQLFGQTTINIGSQGRNFDFSQAPFTRPATVGTSLPATCTTGQMFFNSAAAAGQNLYACSVTNVWTPVGAGSTSSLNLTDGATLLRNNVSTPQALQGALNLPAGSATAATADSSAANWQTVRQHLGHVCVEDFLTPAMNGDYGKAIIAAVQAQSLTTQSRLDVCSPGGHSIGTQAVFDRPISFWMHNSTLVVGAALSSSPVVISGAVLTAGSQTITVPSTAGLTAGMAVGGIGLKSTTYIQNIPSSTTITVSLPAGITFDGFITAGSALITNLNSMRGLEVGQTLSGYGIPASATITAVSYATNSLTMSVTGTASVSSPSSFSIGGTWTSSVKAVAAQPTIAWVYNASALHNSEGQMIGGEMHGVWIADPGFRTLPGVQGVQIDGWDRFVSEHLQVDNLQGTALILGGNAEGAGAHGVVRESQFYDSQLRDSGDGLTGQPELELMTPSENNLATSDEINQIGFVGGQCVFFYGEGITIGTFNKAHGSAVGPRLLWFSNNFQVENGSHVPNQNIANPYDVVHIIQGADIYFQGDEIAVPGYGRSVFDVESGGTLSVFESRVYASSKALTYQVGVTNGSTTVTWTSGGNNGFDASGLWDGQGAQVSDGSACSPCTMLLRMSGAVSADGKTLQLASPYAGTTGPATLTIGASGYYVNATSTLGRLIALGNTYTDPDAATLSMLGLSSGNAAWTVGQVFSNGAPITVADYGSGLNVGQSLKVTSSRMTSGAGARLLAPSLQAGANVSLQVGTDTGNYDSAFLAFVNAGAGSSKNFGYLGIVGSLYGELSWYANGKVTTANNTLDDGAGHAVFSNGVQLGGNGPTWSAGSTAPSGSCVNGSLYSLTGSGALYVCQMSAWVQK